jgi:hypothetical protein
MAVVAVASFFTRKTGACGTAHYVFFQLLGGAVVETLEDLWVTKYDDLAARSLAVLLNVGVFAAFVRVWFVNAPRKWFVVGLLALTALYLTSYFFLFPTRDCP